MTEADVISKYIFTTLTGDAQLQGLIGERVYIDAAPFDATYPCIVFQMAGTLDSPAVGTGGRISTSADWLVRAVGEGASYTVVSPLATRITAVLDKEADYEYGGFYLSGAYRTREVRYPERKGQDTSFVHQGGSFHFFISPTTG